MKTFQSRYYSLLILFEFPFKFDHRHNKVETVVLYSTVLPDPTILPKPSKHFPGI